jgi:phosphoribosylglycinamide formyltransferase 1
LVVIGVLVSGRGTNLQALVDDGLPIAAVASNKAGVQALERARDAGVEVAVFALEDFANREERDAAMGAWLFEHGVELVACAGYMQLLTPRFLDLFPGRIVNVHPSLLPAFPGTTPIEDALAAGVSETGVTVHFVDEGVDSGPMILQARIRVEEEDTADTLRARLHEVEHRLLPYGVRLVLEGKVAP